MLPRITVVSALWAAGASGGSRAGGTPCLLRCSQPLAGPCRNCLVSGCWGCRTLCGCVKATFYCGLFSEMSELFLLKLPSKFQPEADTQYGKHQSELTRVAQRYRQAIMGSQRWLIAGCGAAIRKACSNLEVVGPPASLHVPGHQWHCCRRAGTRSAALPRRSPAACPAPRCLRGTGSFSRARCRPPSPAAPAPLLPAVPGDPAEGTGTGALGAPQQPGPLRGLRCAGEARPEEAALPSASAALW